MLLAKAGVEVTVLEKQPRVGGRTSVIESDGYRFDLGPTFFLYPQILQEIFQAVGRDLFKEVPMTKLDPQYRLTFGAGGELNATSGPRTHGGGDREAVAGGRAAVPAIHGIQPREAGEIRAVPANAVSRVGRA